MKNKILYYTIAMLFISNNLFSQKKKNSPIFTAKAEGWHKADSLHRYYANDTTTYLHVKTFIKNSSSDTLCYLDWSCSWMNFYIIDSKEISFPMLGMNCFHNVLQVVEIPPYQTAERLLLLEGLSTFDLTKNQFSKASTSQLRNTNFKIGFKSYKVDTKKVKDLYSSEIHKYENSKNEIILWSNVLELP